MPRLKGWAGVLVLGLVLAGTGPAVGGEASWRRVADLPAAPVSVLVRNPGGGEIAAAAAGDIYLSADGGRVWRRIAAPGGDVQALAFISSGPPGPPGPAGAGSFALVAAGETGVQWTRDLETWRRLELASLGRRGAVRALRAEPEEGGRLAFGTDDGVTIAHRVRGVFRESASALPGRRVTALAWLAEGALAVATEEGLYRFDPARPGRADRIDSRPARDVDAAAGIALAITERGVLRGSPGGDWLPVPAGGVLAGSATSVDALAASPGSFAIADGFTVWRIGPGGPPSAMGADPPGEATIAVLDLPDGRLLGATDRGLFTLDSPGSARAGGLPAYDEAPALAGRFPLDRIAGLREPDIASVRSAALRAASLEPGRIRRNFRGVRYRALLPDLEISLRRRSIFNHQADQDEAFTGGALRHLFDNSRDRDRERDFVIAAEWDLGSLFFNPDELDVSEEARRVLTLRDDVLDELNQIYYERQRALLALLRLEERAGGAGGAGAGGDEIAELRIRIAELTARLDAWTEGFFSREKERLAGVPE